MWWEAPGEADDTQETRGEVLMGDTGTWQRGQSTMLGSSKAPWVKMEEEAILAMLKGHSNPWGRHICSIPPLFQASDQ